MAHWTFPIFHILIDSFFLNINTIWLTNNQLISSFKYPLFVNIVKIHKVPTQMFLALAQPTPECLMSDAGQVTADEGGQVGRWAGHQWCSGVPKYPHSLQLRRRLHKRLHRPCKRALAPTGAQLHKRARPFLLLGAGALFFTAALLFPWESLWTGKETM